MDPLRAQCAIGLVLDPLLQTSGGSWDLQRWLLTHTNSIEANQLTHLPKNQPTASSLRVRWSCFFPYVSSLHLLRSSLSWWKGSILSKNARLGSIGSPQMSKILGKAAAEAQEQRPSQPKLWNNCCVLLNIDLNHVKSSFLVPDKPQVNKHQPSFQFCTMWGFCLPRPAGPRSKNVKLPEITTSCE